MTTREVDVVVIGAGPGGYVAAIRAAQLGLEVVCVDREALGGTCLNWGCIPTKALLRSAEVLELCHRATEFGVTLAGVEADFARMVQRSRDIVDRITRGVGHLLRKHKVSFVRGAARLGGAGVVEVTDAGGVTTQLRGRSIILATGARAKHLPGAPHDGAVVIGYREALALPRLPQSMAIIGAGAIGVEFASLYRSLGVDVTVIEFLDRLVPLEDEAVSAELRAAFEARGIRVLTAHRVTGVTVTDGCAHVAVEQRDRPDPKVTLTADHVLVSIGITPNTDDLGLEPLGVGLRRGFITVDDNLQTAVTGLYAIGDVASAGPALAHVASAQAIHVAEHIAGLPTAPIDYDSVPACTYCHPEIASVGLTEAQARSRGVAIRVGRFPLGALGKTVAAGGYPGFAKLIWRADNHALLGAHLIGTGVTELIAEPTLAKATEVNAESLVRTIHAHPTFCEAIKEATDHALGHAIHL